ncbi:DUF1987 domain-containing protein [Desulfovibrio mangrovi]|uniref:DUF1987 domain-containing protein n=1 Tax=Desulfovibrio mangrovi TaxID=2976983 RepID=UPI0022475D7D|nr:DUF1987 domain-containing protein [Desulfovibrio mangrovi]UZP66419.1 DUF1987 domain-containing protein [Desulfovibrio mangrovi]
MSSLKHLQVEATKSSPAIDFNPETHNLSLRGESYPENCSRFYAPVFDWLREYLSVSQNQPMTLEMEIVYFNSSSSKTFMDLFDMLDAAAQAGKSVCVRWRYDEENETALECGEEFQEDVQHINFELVSVAA